MKIVIVGVNTFGLANGVLLSKENEVVILDESKDIVDKINNKIYSTIDNELNIELENSKVTATTDKQSALCNADYVVVECETEYDSELNLFDTSLVDRVITEIININPKTVIILKATVPVGYTRRTREKYNTENIIYSPDFLREEKAHYDVTHPSRIVMGEKSKRAETFVSLLKSSNTPVIYIGSTEAEAVKLFANTYLAMRIAYFNELDTYAEIRGLNTKDIIDGVCLDPRIGDLYNNPSFGYGGYYLPKDTKQLLSNYLEIPQELISSVVKANHTRKDHIAKEIKNMNPKIVGIYRVSIEHDADNFEKSAIKGIIRRIKSYGIEVVIYEPSIPEDTFFNSRVIKDIDEFKNISDVILVNRYTNELDDVKFKVYTRDIRG